MTALSRRRFLSIAAAAGGALTLPTGAAHAGLARWQGRALGAQVSMQLVGLDTDQAQAVFADVAAELGRLEGIFSLYRPDSALVQLNARGHLLAPPAELLELLALADRIHRATDGAFDPSLQPLWRAHAFAAEQGRTATAAELTRARARAGWSELRFDGSEIRLPRPGMGLTLNGIAQGYITDRIAARLRARGLRDLLLDMGEIAALGQRDGGGDWQVGISDPSGKLLRKLHLSDRALASSAPGGMLLNGPGKVPHILDLRGEMPPHQVVSVSAPSAAIADGLSTAGCLMPAEKLARALAAFPEQPWKP